MPHLRKTIIKIVAIALVLYAASHQMINERFNGTTDVKMAHRVNNTFNGTKTCKEPVLYNKIFKLKPNTKEERELEVNIEKYCGDKENVYNILEMKPIKFDHSFKNPCWIGQKGNGPVADNKIHCLPYVYILGIKKCGTTDTYERLGRHPMFLKLSYKETLWFSMLRFGRGVRSIRKFLHLLRNGPDVQSLNFYVSMFDHLAREIQSHPSETEGNKTVYNLITGDGSTYVLNGNPRWHLWPGNEGLLEPRYTNLHYIKHLNPNAKIIILFRDPVERLYSDFLFMAQLQEERVFSPELFHEQALLAIRSYNDCFSIHSLRQCFYNESIPERLQQKGVQFADSFIDGFYALQMREIYSVFAKQNVLPLVMFDKQFSEEGTMKKIFEFLDIGIPSQSIMKKVLMKGKANSSSNQKMKFDCMLNVTRRVLQDFYKPFNHDMAVLMNDDRYLFNP